MVCPEILGIYRTQTFQTMYGCAWTFKPKGYFLSYLRIPEPQLQPKHLSWGFGEEKKGSRPVSPILYTISAPRIKKNIKANLVYGQGGQKIMVALFCNGLNLRVIEFSVKPKAG